MLTASAGMSNRAHVCALYGEMNAKIRVHICAYGEQNVKFRARFCV